jgi:hypothetical protein
MAENQNNPNYYAVIPASVRYCKDLIPSAKLLYGEISALCNKEGYCWAGNKYFEELYEVDETTIQRWLKSLKDLGFITVEIEKKGMITKRKIWMGEVIQKNLTTPQKRGGRHPEKEVFDTAKTPPIIIQCSNTTRKQQQAPFGANADAAAVSSFFLYLRELHISEKDANFLMKYPENEVRRAVAFATHPDTKINKSLIRTIVWAIKEKPVVPEPKDPEKNRKMAFACEQMMISESWNIEILSKKVLFTSKSPTNCNAHEISYDKTGFKEELEKFLKELKFERRKA